MKINGRVVVNKGGRPRGRFTVKKLTLLWILNQQQPCVLTNQDLANKMGCCIKQISRYIKALKVENSISVEIKRHRFGTGFWANDRKITVISTQDVSAFRF